RRLHPGHDRRRGEPRGGQAAGAVPVDGDAGHALEADGVGGVAADVAPSVEHVAEVDVVEALTRQTRAGDDLLDDMRREDLGGGLGQRSLAGGSHSSAGCSDDYGLGHGGHLVLSPGGRPTRSGATRGGTRPTHARLNSTYM